MGDFGFGKNWPLWLLWPVLIAFAYLGYCSFPVSDDFVLARDTHQGFFWSISYWLGFWLSAWFTLAFEVSIPLAFGYLDYGLYFFSFIALILLGSWYWVFRSMGLEKSNSIRLAAFFLIAYLLFNPNIAETVYWNIGAIAYSVALATFTAFVAVHLQSVHHLQQLKPGKDFIPIAGFLGILLSAAGWIWVKKQIPAAIKTLDALFPPSTIYFMWLGFVLFFFGLIWLSKRYYFVCLFTLGLAVFLVVGSGPQTAVFVNAYLALYLVWYLVRFRKIEPYTLFFLLVCIGLTLFMLNLPGTKNRIVMTNHTLVKDVNFMLRGVLYLLDVLFVQHRLWLSYLLALGVGLFSSFGPSPMSKPAWFLLVLLAGVFGLTFLAFVMYYNSNGHFPFRLVANFYGIYVVLFWAIGYSLSAIWSEDKRIMLSKIRPLMGVLAVVVFLFSPNFNYALADIFSGEAWRFRSHKLAVFEQIKNCVGDTCEVPYRAFNLKTIGDQDFIFPGESGFVLSHKIFISRYFGKEFIRYEAATIPPEVWQKQGLNPPPHEK